MNTLTTLAINDPKFSVTALGIQFNVDLSFEEWDALGQKLGEVHNSMAFAIGDWINYGQNRWGEKYEEALARTGLTYSTLSEYSYVARKVQFCARAQNWTLRAT